LFVELSANFADDDIFGGADVFDLLGAAGQKFLHLEGSQVKAVKLVDRVEIDRNRDQLPIDAGQDLVLVLPPFSEAREVIKYFFAIGVEDVRAVFVDENASIVKMVVGVSSNVRPAIDQQHLLARTARDPLGQHAAGISGAHDQIVEHLH